MTQKDLAKEFNVATSTISNWETGTRLPSLHELKRVAEYFNVSLNIFDSNSQQKQEGLKTDAGGDRQIVDFRPLGLSFPSWSHIVFLVSVLMLVISSFITYLVVFAFLIIGVIGLVIVFVNMLIEADKRQRISYKRLQIPVLDTVLYQHRLSDEGVLKLQKRASTLSVFHLVIGVGFDGCLLLVLTGFGSDLLTAFVSLFVLASLMTGVFHYRSVHGHLIIRKRISYQMAFYDLKYPVLLVVLVMNVIALSGYALFLAMTPRDSLELITGFTSVLGLLTVLISYLIYISYHQFIKGYKLIRITPDGSENVVM